MFRCKVSWIMLNKHLASQPTDSVPKFMKTWEPCANYVHIDLQVASCLAFLPGSLRVI